MYAFLYVVVMALSVVWVGHLHDYFSAALMLLMVSFSAIVIYSLGSLSRLAEAYSSIVCYPWLWVCMSVTFAVTWWLMYFTTIYASPRAAIVVFYLVVGSMGCLFDKQVSGVVLCVIALIMSVWLLPELSIITVISGIGCGLAGYVYMFSSGRYAKLASLTASQVLGVRFFPLFFSALAVVLLIPHQYVFMNDSIHFLKIILAVSLLIAFNLLPNYCAQKSIMFSGPNRFSQIIAYTPAATFLIQGVFHHTWDWKIMVLCLVVSMLLSCLVALKK